MSCPNKGSLRWPCKEEQLVGHSEKILYLLGSFKWRILYRITPAGLQMVIICSILSLRSCNTCDTRWYLLPVLYFSSHGHCHWGLNLFKWFWSHLPTMKKSIMVKWLPTTVSSSCSSMCNSGTFLVISIFYQWHLQPSCEKSMDFVSGYCLLVVSYRGSRLDIDSESNG